MTRFDLLDFENYYNANLSSYRETGKIKYPLIFLDNTSDTPVVCYHDNLDYNTGASSKYNLLNLHHDGGCVVSFKGDIMIGYFTKNYELFAQQVRDSFYNKLIDLIHIRNDCDLVSEDGINVKIEIDNNDILIDGKKISGSMGVNFIDDYMFVGFFIAYDSDVSIIREVCNKPMLKEPVGLNSFGVNHDELEVVLLDIIEEFEASEVNS